MQTKPSVSNKSTKQEIFDAYQALLSQQTELPSATLPKKLTAINNQLKNQLSAQIADLMQSLEEKLTEVSNQFDQTTQVLEQLNELHVKQTQTLTQEKIETQKTQKREEEEYKYEFEKLKKRQTEELTEQKQKAEAEIAVKKADLKLQEDELKELRQKVSTFETELNKAIKEAIAKTTDELTREYDHQKALLHPSFPQLSHYFLHCTNVGSRIDTYAYHIYIFLDSRRDNLVRSLMQTCIYYLQARFTQPPRYHDGAQLMSVQAGLGHQYPDPIPSHLTLLLIRLKPGAQIHQILPLRFWSFRR
ncbi:MAG: hypothetical protein UV04_C0027G0002 [Candidatus Gottesmanbacteria bacterium GW2011_GWA2_42_16]|nr:MAG: hypothetical protein UV04_C0027G0002 [Candidatus Gottesmanbacteria bacterium GW2011_GWA2_42_16]